MLSMPVYPHNASLYIKYIVWGNYPSCGALWSNSNHHGDTQKFHSMISPHLMPENKNGLN